MVRQQENTNYGIYDNEGLNPVYNGGGARANILPDYYDIEPPVTYINNSPLGNVKVYDLDAEIEPIQRVQITPNVPNLANMDTYYNVTYHLIYKLYKLNHLEFLIHK